MNVLGPKGLMERLKSSGGKPNVVSFFSALISCILIFYPLVLYGVGQPWWYIVEKTIYMMLDGDM